MKIKRKVRRITIAGKRERKKSNSSLNKPSFQVGWPCKVILGNVQGVYPILQPSIDYFSNLSLASCLIVAFPFDNTY